jgi:hypothetical protein
MAYTHQELEVFTACFALAEQGCKTSHELEKGLYKTIWWISPLESARLVKVWIRDRKKIDDTLRQLKEIHNDIVRNVEDHSPESTPGCGGASCATSQSV